MPDDDISFPQSQSYQGKRFSPAHESELHAIIKMALDYRGDVTLRLNSGQEITGFIFDRHDHTERPFLRMFLENLPDSRVVAYEEITEIVFSGEDTAFGKSWEEWTKKWEKSLMRKSED